MNSYNWTINWIKAIPNTGNNSNVVSTVNWGVTGANANNSNVGTVIESTMVLPLPNGSFIPYNTLTQNDILNWVWANGVDKNAVESQIDIQLQATSNLVNSIVEVYATEVNVALPWTANT